MTTRSVIYLGIGGGAEAVIMAEVTRTTEESHRTGVISVLVAVRQTGLLVGNQIVLILTSLLTLMLNHEIFMFLAYCIRFSH